MKINRRDFFRISALGAATAAEACSRGYLDTRQFLDPGEDYSKKAMKVILEMAQLTDEQLKKMPHKKVVKYLSKVVPAYFAGQLTGKSLTINNQEVSYKGLINGLLNRYLSLRDPELALGIGVESDQPVEISSLGSDKKRESYIFNIGQTSWHMVDGVKFSIDLTADYSDLEKGIKFEPKQKLEMVYEGKGGGKVSAIGGGNWTSILDGQCKTFLEKAGYIKIEQEKTEDALEEKITDLKVLHPLRQITGSQLFDRNKSNGEYYRSSVQAFNFDRLLK